MTPEMIEHIKQIERTALDCPDEERRCEAVRTLALIVLLVHGTDSSPDGECADNVVQFILAQAA